MRFKQMTQQSLITAICFVGLLGFGLLASGVTTTTAYAEESLGHPVVDKLLKENWQAYQKTFIQPDGRVIDHGAGISTSEGQSYGLLRALWMRDKGQFERIYNWTVNNLQKRKDDHLFAWKWGQRHDKTWGPLDNTAATDADQDIAFSLIMAHKLWGNDFYLKQARLILNDIWDKETLPSPIGRVVLPGDWKFDGKQIQINPSYFAPYLYRVFAEVDPNHPWEQLIKSSYTIVNQSLQLTQTKLPPDWVEFSVADGSVKLYPDPQDNRSDYGYEAIRVYWRFALDGLLNTGLTLKPLSDATTVSKSTSKKSKVPVSSSNLLGSSNYLLRFWQVRGELPATISWDGIPRTDKIESAAVYGASLPAFMAQNKTLTEQMIARKIITNLKPGGQWNTPNDYYSQNWLWFGLALYDFANRSVAIPKNLSALERMEWFMTSY